MRSFRAPKQLAYGMKICRYEEIWTKRADVATSLHLNNPPPLGKQKGLKSPGKLTWCSAAILWHRSPENFTKHRRVGTDSRCQSQCDRQSEEIGSRSDSGHSGANEFPLIREEQLRKKTIRSPSYAS